MRKGGGREGMTMRKAGERGREGMTMRKGGGEGMTMRKGGGEGEGGDDHEKGRGRGGGRG